MTVSEPVTSAPDMPLEERFGFGKNWTSYIQLMDDSRIHMAMETLKIWFGLDSFEGKTFVDLGCGSGLFSLAARKLGARVTSIDFDPNSVRCAETLREKFFPQDEDNWKTMQGSVLDESFMESLGTHDLVYSWGVLHHTGHMWTALANAVARVEPGGRTVIAIYNDQGVISDRWRSLKQRYCEGSDFRRRWIIGTQLIKLWGKTFLRDLVKKGNPLHTWKNYDSVRGMDAYHDLVDWVGGYPFEVAKPEHIIDFYQDRGFRLKKLKSCGGGLGCNEFAFYHG